MKIRGIIEEDFINYKKPSMVVITPYCSFKCEKEYGCSICHNSDVVKLPIIDISDEEIIERYKHNPISEAIVFCGLEPFDSNDIESLINSFRNSFPDDIVIYTGYTKEECIERFNWVYKYHNIIIKYGRFIPNSSHCYDKILGVELASENQYAEKIE